MSLLAVSNVTKTFGGLSALANVSLDVREGEIRGLIGPNGSGKSTFFNVVSGIHRSTSGTILLRGEAIEGLPPERRQQRGLARTFQEIQLFYDLTVLENVLIGCHRLGRSGVAGALLRTGRVRAEEGRLRDIARECLDFVGLLSVENERARNISYGHQRLLEIARAISSSPRIVLLDEPAAGMNPTETRHLMAQVERVVGRGITVFLVEHNVQMIMSLCQRITVLHHGQVIAEGDAASIQRDALVVEAYLGKPLD